MYESIIVLQYGVFRKEATGLVATYNNSEKYVKTITEVSEEECRRKVEEFLHEADFKSIQEQEIKK